jgi:hypothetical protein
MKNYPPTDILKDQFLQLLDQLRADLNITREQVRNQPEYNTVFKDRCDRVEKTINAMDKAVEQVDGNLKPNRGLNQLRSATRGMEKIKEEIKYITVPIKK